MDTGASEPTWRERGKTGRPDEDGVPRDVDGKCSRCGRPWPCMLCLTMTPPFVPIWNNV